MRRLRELAADLAAGRTTSRALVEDCLARIADQAGEGARVFVKVNAESARREAEAHDAARQQGQAASPFAGIPISVKDNIDTMGDVTTGGSIVLRDEKPAARDAASVSRLRAAGFIPIGRTNMSEFAALALGVNIHFGTPLNPYDRAGRRIPGGSSSGAAVSVADGMAMAALGTDTGGSCRIPAALCGVAGFKPTARRVSLEGVLPLSHSVDCVGPLGASADCCLILDEILTGDTSRDAVESVRGLRLAVPQTLLLDDLDPYVADVFDACLKALRDAGAEIVETPLKELAEIPQLNSKGGLAAPEAYACHRDLIAAKSDLYDPRILKRILRGKDQSADDYNDLLKARADFIARFDKALAPFDAVLAPTVVMGAPKFSEVDSEDDFSRINMRIARNTSVVSFMDGCAVSIPCHRPGEMPAGLMIFGAQMTDKRVLAIAGAAETLFEKIRSK